MSLNICLPLFSMNYIVESKSKKAVQKVYRIKHMKKYLKQYDMVISYYLKHINKFM